MLPELTPAAFDYVRPLFASLPGVVPIHAILEGNTPGQIFVDDPQRPTSVLIWTLFHFGFLGGRADNAAFNAALRDLLTGTIFPAARQSRDPTAILYPASPAWLAPLDNLLAAYRPIPFMRQTFTFDPARFQPAPDRLPEDVRMCPVDRSLLGTADRIVQMLSQLWYSVDAFLARGFGFCLVDGAGVASECVSVFVAGRQREIGIGTLEAYRRRGYAAATASAFITHCLAHDLEPVWACWLENAPSIALAQKVGFTPAGQHVTRLFLLQ